MVNESFRSLVRSEGERLYRDLPWRNTRDPYAIWISEVMLQQTQVARVLGRWESWLDEFPSVFALAEAPTASVLSAWQGMGYNRRALALKEAARLIAEERDGRFPSDARELCALPGIGPATAQGIRSFAFDLPGIYLETNVRTVFLHHLFPEAVSVPDRELKPLVEAACPGDAVPFAAPRDAGDTPRSWYYALLDYGAELKKSVPNPSRRSREYARQSRFEGSHRQKRALVVRMLLAAQQMGEGVAAEDAAAGINEMEHAAGRALVDAEVAAGILAELAGEGFCVEDDGAWRIA